MTARARTVGAACRVCWQRRPWVGSVAGGVEACWDCMQRRSADLAATAADALEHVGLARDAHHVREGGSLLLRVEALLRGVLTARQRGQSAAALTCSVAASYLCASYETRVGGGS